MKFLIPILLLITSSAFASGDRVTNNYITNPVTIITSGEDVDRAIATSIANNHQFDFATYDYQGTINRLALRCVF